MVIMWFGSLTHFIANQAFHRVNQKLTHEFKSQLARFLGGFAPCINGNLAIDLIFLGESYVCATHDVFEQLYKDRDRPLTMLQKYRNALGKLKLPPSDKDILLKILGNWKRQVRVALSRIKSR